MSKLLKGVVVPKTLDNVQSFALVFFLKPSLPVLGSSVGVHAGIALRQCGGRTAIELLCANGLLPRAWEYVLG